MNPRRVPVALLSSSVIASLAMPARADEPQGNGKSVAESAAVAAPSPVATPSPVPAAGPAEELRLFMPDGQLRSHTVEVFLTADILYTSHPRLRLLGSHAVTGSEETEDTWWTPLAVARHQTRTMTVAGVEQARQGTLLLFDLRRYPIPWFKPMMRLRPIVVWDPPAGSNEAPVCDPKNAPASCPSVVGEEEINVGNPVAAYLWSAVLPLGLVAGLVVACGARFVDVLRGIDGRLSLSRCQAAAWTLAIGWVVMGFGFMQRATPDLPWQAAVLMGLSLTTAAVSYGKEAGAAPTGRKSAALSDLIAGDDTEVSLSRVQMLLWTCVALVLFVFKSVLQGVVWAVPGELVVLMGLSQAGYLLPKLIKPAGQAAGASDGSVADGKDAGETRTPLVAASPEKSQTSMHAPIVSPDP